MDGDGRDDRPDHLFRWIEAAQTRVGTELDAVLRGPARDLGMRRLRILQLIPADGTSQQELARRAMVSKQAVAGLVDGLEADGLVERTADPDDGRAWLVRRTRQGDSVNRAMDDAMAEVERRLAADLGPDRYEALRSSLAELGRTPAGLRRPAR